MDIIERSSLVRCQNEEFVLRRGGAANGRWVYDEQQDVTTTAGDESEGDLGQMNSFTFDTDYRLNIESIVLCAE